MSKMKSTDKRVIRTAKAIKRAFYELAEETEMSKITVTALAEKAGINRKTFYHHYDSVDDLFDDLLEDEAEELTRALSNAAMGPDNRLDVESLFLALSEGLTESMHREGAALAKADVTQVLERIEPILIRKITEEQGIVVSGFDERTTGYLVTYFCAGLLAAYQQWMLSGQDLELDRLSSVLGAAVVGGLAGAKILENRL